MLGKRTLFVINMAKAISMVNKLKAYRDEDRKLQMTPLTHPKTFVSGNTNINFRWAGVPFYIRTGKRMKFKTIQVVVEFKEVPMNLYGKTINC